VHPYPGSLTTPGYQCVEFSERYLYYRYGVTMGISTNGDQIVGHYVSKYPSKFKAIANGSVGEPPVAGDVLSFSNSANFSSNSGGHTAVVQSSSVDVSGNGTLTIVDENAVASGVESLSVSSWNVHYSGYAYIKWLHARDNTPPRAGNLAVDGGFEGGSGWSAGPATNFVDYHNGQVPGESAHSGTHYAATNTTSTSGGIYQDINGLSIKAGDTICGTAFLRTQAPNTGAAGSFVLWLLGGTQNEHAVTYFNSLRNGTKWSQQQTCVNATISHTSLRIQFYPTPNSPTLEIDDIDVH
jgi:hypothetical protein